MISPYWTLPGIGRGSVHSENALPAAAGPAAAAEKHEGGPRVLEQAVHLGHLRRGRRRAHDVMPRRIGDRGLREERVLGQRQHYRAGPPGERGMEGAAHVFGNALDAV